MSPANDPMTFDELSELYRVEMKSQALVQTRKDLFRAAADLLASLRREYERLAGIDPDSVMAEGAQQRRKKADMLCKEIVIIRTKKVAKMAHLGARGAKQDLGCLADEERAYYDAVLELTKRQFSEIDRLRGKRTVATRIDEPPVRETKAPEAALPPVPEPESAEEFFGDGFGPDEPFPEDSFDIPDEPFPEPDAASAEEPEPVPEKYARKTEDASTPEELVLVRILENLPEFAGVDRNYSLCGEDLVVLPKCLADPLINTEKAAAVRPSSRGFSRLRGIPDSRCASAGFR